MPAEHSSDTFIDERDAATLQARWLVACEQLRVAYDWWFEAERGDGADRYATVTAMIDQEEAAAASYARALHRRTEQPSDAETADLPRHPGETPSVGPHVEGPVVTRDRSRHRAG